MFNKNSVHLPDRLCHKECIVDLNKLYLNYDDNNNYHLYCYDKNKNLSFD